MEKFLSIPVTDQQRQLLSCNGIATVIQASTTTVVVTYTSGLAATITHATAGAGVETARDGIQRAIESALIKPWTVPVYAVTAADIPFTISGITVALLVQAAS